jgi:hypothetical protein
VDGHAGPSGPAVGRQVVVSYVEGEGGPLVLDAAAGTWHEGPPWPTPRTGGGATVMTDRQLLTWGGYGPDDEGATSEGFVYTPP